MLFSDDKCANIFEALVGTLRAAKKRKIVKFDGEILLQPNRPVITQQKREGKIQILFYNKKEIF